MDATQYVHVIMPVGSDPMYPAKRAAIHEAAKRVGMEARFPDYIPSRPVFALSDLKNELSGANSVLVDLTHERPSCYYELGIAEAMEKKVYIIAEEGTPIHQSVGRELARYYRDLADLARVVEDALQHHSE